MPKASWINTFRSITDNEKLAAYVELAGPAMRAAGGTFLARGLPAAAFESGIVERTTLIEFASVDAAVAASHSDGYQAALAALGDGAERDLRSSKRRTEAGASSRLRKTGEQPFAAAIRIPGEQHDRETPWTSATRSTPLRHRAGGRPGARAGR